MINYLPDDLASLQVVIKRLLLYYASSHLQVCMITIISVISKRNQNSIEAILAFEHSLIKPTHLQRLEMREQSYQARILGIVNILFFRNLVSYSLI